MKFVLFYHSLSSDWNHGNAHFLRGIVSELLAQGHAVAACEPADGWSIRNLREKEGAAAVEGFREYYPGLAPLRYDPETLDLDAVLDGADVVIVHEWNPPALLRRIGRHRRSARSGYHLLFHDTHHRAVSAPHELDEYPLDDFDGTLAFGEAIAEVYRRRGWGRRAWTWHEAADTRVFRPPARPPLKREGLVWIGNWGDDERVAELETFLIEPARRLGIGGSIYGVRYPQAALSKLDAAGLDYCGWLANYEVPRVFQHHDFTVHVPRRFYSESLPGIPTIRVFEALACGIPLISAPWSDAEGLFRPGRDYVVVRNGEEMRAAMRTLSTDRAMAAELARSGLDTITRRHTCARRVAELLAICESLDAGSQNVLREAVS